MDLQVSQRDDPAAAGGLEQTGLAGVGMRFYGGKRVGLFAGLDARFGAGAQGGFAYDAAFLPVGGGVQLGPTLLFGVASGVAVSGVTDHVGFAVELPVEARLLLSLGHHVQLTTWGRVGWIAGEDARQSGSENAPLGDELRAGATIRFGRGDTRRRTERWGNGIYVGVTYGERLMTREVGLVIGYGITDGFYPQRRREPRGL
jgi:hypothetical protein